MTRLRPLAALVLLAGSAAPAAAQADRNWTGSVTSGDGLASWNVTANYGTTLSPTIRRLLFDANTMTSGGAAGNIRTKLDADFAIDGLLVADLPAGASALGVLVASGGDGNRVLTLNADHGANTAIDLRTADRDLEVSARLTTGAAQTWAVAGGRTLTVSGPATVTQNLLLNFDPAAAAGSGGTAGTVVLSNAGNTFAGSAVTLRNGLLRLNTAAALAGATRLTLDPADSDNSAVTTDRAVVALAANVTVATVPLTLNSPAASLRSTLRLLGGAGGWAGGLTLAGAGTVEFDAQGGSALGVTGAVAGSGFTGTLQVGGGGAGSGGTIAGPVTLAGAATLTKTDAASTWAVTSTGNTWGTTAVAAGTLRVGASGTLPAGAALRLGQPSGTAGERLGTLELVRFADQTVTGLTTASSPPEVNPNGNRVGVGDQSLGGVGDNTTLTVLGSSAFAGVLVDAVGSQGGRRLGLTVGGSLTLQSANTYTGPTTVAAGGTLTLGTVSGSAGGGFTNYGSVAASPLVTLADTTSTLAAAGLGGGPNAGGGGRLGLAPGQVLQGRGTVAGPGLVVPAAAAVRGGLAGNVADPLTVAGGLTTTGGTPGAAGGQWVIDVAGTSASNTPVGRLAITGAGNALTLDATGGPVVLRLANAQNLVVDRDNPQAYTFAVAAAAGGFQLTGGSAGAGTTAVTSYTYGTDFVLDLGRPIGGFAGGGPTLVSSGTNPATLSLTFIPVPEPAGVLLLAAAGLGGVRRVRRRILAG